jgi:excisionase family DNA binding protein
MLNLLSVNEAAEVSGYHPEHIRRLIREGKIKAQKFASVWQVDRYSLQVYIRKTEIKGEKRGPKRLKTPLNNINVV